MLTYAKKSLVVQGFLESPCYFNIKKVILLIVIHIKYPSKSNLHTLDICGYDSTAIKPRMIETLVDNNSGLGS